MNKKESRKTAVIAGAGQMGRPATELLSSNNVELLAFADNSEKAWGKTILGAQVMPTEKALALGPDIVIISVLGAGRAGEIYSQIRSLGYEGEILQLRELYEIFDIRSRCIHSLAERVERLEIPGAVAELGVYKGDTAWQINELFTGRQLYLFDTFEGFDKRDLDLESERQGPQASGTQNSAPQTDSKSPRNNKKDHRDFSDTSVEMVMARMPNPENCIIKKGYFPETAEGLEDERFAFVSLDPDLYAPVLSGLEFFYPRLSKGGVIVVHDYDNKQFEGVRKAVDEFEQELLSKGEGPLALVPLGDLHGSCVIIKK